MTSNHEEILSALNAVYCLTRILDRSCIRLDEDFPNEEFLKAKDAVEDILFPEGDGLLDDVDATWRPISKSPHPGKELI